MESYAILGWGIAARAAYRYLSLRPHGDIRIYLPREERACAEREDPHLIFADSTEEIREDVLVRSPGMRPDAPVILRALSRGARLTSEIQLFMDACPAPVYAVTGSDGKTTTATLAACMFREMGYVTYLGGNIGVSLLDFIDDILPTHRVVLELSSFQLMGTEPILAGAALTNLTENHLNWHTDMTEYRRAKECIFPHAARRVVNARLYIPYHALTFSAYEEGANYHVSHEYMMRGDIPLLSLSDAKLRGRHNVENLLCAAALTDADPHAFRTVATTFSGVEHRMEFCGIYGGVACYESSIDTTPARTAVTLAALPQGCTVLAGGAGKNLSYEPLARALTAHAAHVVFTGEVGEEMEAALVAHHARVGGGHPSHTYIADFTAAVDAALAVTPTGGTLVLSPAATSFDAFSSYRERGEVFRRCLERHAN